MTSKQYSSISSLPEKINDNESSSRSAFCKVCGDKAYFNNYGALSCQSCRTFFRRNGLRPELVRPCRYDGQCEVNMLTRHVCTACRLRKCFTIGMSTILIRKEELRSTKSSLKMKSNKRQTVTDRQITFVPQLPTLNLLRNDQSSLSTYDWTLLSNITHAFDKFSLISTLEETLKNLSSTSAQIHFNTDDAFKTIASSYIFIRSFVSSTPDFQVMNLSEQQSLLNRNLHTGSSLCFNTFVRDTNLFCNAECSSSYLAICGSEMFHQLKHNTKLLDPDTTLLKILSLVIMFSSNNFLLDTNETLSNDSLLYGTFRLFGSQNVYLELLWKYMMCRYGYCQTVIRFSGMITCVLSKIKQATNAYMYNNTLHDFVDEISKQTKQILIISQKDVVPLWGKTLLCS